MAAEHNAAPTTDKVDGQHWITVQELWMKKDIEQCESWKDEVQNILIFSGLFSAIVTAFIIVSQQDLSPDPAQESLELLRQIAAQSAGQHYIAQSRPTTDHTIAVCVNVFWFLSLVFSLTAALIGIVSLQWIRTHVRILRDERESLGLSHMHSLGLQESYIPVIFNSLPVILIFGLVLFLVGLVVFLFELSWPVAIPVAVAIGLTFVFLLTTTAHPGLQRLPIPRPNVKPNCFPSPYRSPQSLLVLQFVTLWEKLWSKNGAGRTQAESDGRVDWTMRSRIWLRQRQEDFGVEKKRLSHLESKPEGAEEKLFAYDTIKALLSVEESRSAESEKDRTALAKCLAEVLPIHLDLFPTGDLADLIPFLPTSEFVPSGLFLQKDAATREDLSAVALLQIASCKGRPSRSSAVIEACVHTTRWLFERPRAFDSVPDKQPLHLISHLDGHTLDVHEVLIATLTHFFNFATDYWPENQSINKTTHTSSYTYWFLVLSAEILTKCSLSKEMQARHTYLLAVIATRLGEEKDRQQRDYLFFTASIYASIISRSPVICSSPFGGDFLRAVKLYHDKYHVTLQADSTRQQLRKAVKASEVSWSDINRAVEALVPSERFQDDLEVGFSRETDQNHD